MTTYTRATQFITVSRNRNATLPIQWKDPTGSPINISGFAITAKMSWGSISFAVTVTISDAAAGQFQLTWTANQVATLPSDLSDAQLSVGIVDTLGEAHDFAIPIFGAVP